MCHYLISKVKMNGANLVFRVQVKHVSYASNSC